MKSRKQINIQLDTYNKLTKLGQFGDSINDIIIGLLNKKKGKK